MYDLNIVTSSALAALKDRGADMAAVSAIYSETREFNVDGGEFSLFRTMFDNDLSLTAYKEGKKGSAAINHFDDESVNFVADSCMAAVDASESNKNWELGPDAGYRYFEDGVVIADMELFFERCRELLELIKVDFPKILVEQMIVSHKSVHEIYSNTVGSCFERRCGSYNLMMMFSAHENGKGSSFFGTGFSTADLTKPFIEQASLRRDLGDVEKQIYTSAVNGKYAGTILVPPSCLGNVLYYALGTFANGSAVYEGTSVWKDKLGTVVADKRLSISLAPGGDEIVCGKRWTADGYLCEDFDLIENGVLKSFIMNKYFANKTGLPRSGNTCIENLVVPAGDTPLADIIKGIDKGLLVGRISGGNPASAGDFSMVAKNSFVIENGRIGDAVSEVMINGNLAEILNNIRAISCEKEPDGGTSLPWMAFDEVTISGK